MKKFFVTVLLLCSFALSAFGADSFVSQQYEMSVSTTASAISGSNLSARYLLIVNKGTDVVRVKMGSAPTGTEGIPIPVGGNWEPQAVPQETIYIKSDSGTQAVYVLRGV